MALRSTAILVCFAIAARAATGAKMSVRRHAAVAVGTGETPITRVVELLRSLQTKTEEDGKTEMELYTKFVCWAQNVIETKRASNAAAESRIQELNTYVADIDAGRIEFTSERTDLEKDLEEVNAGIEGATAMRKKEHEEFLDAEDEMTKALAALDKAILVLKEATAGHVQGVLLAQQVRDRSDALASEGFAARSEEGEALARAADLGERVLTKGDALFLRRLLTGDVPTWDYKKLNRKATFKLGYKARSIKIQEVLQGLQNTFSGSLADAKAKEEAASAQFNKLMESKNLEKERTEASLTKLEVEAGARSMSKEEAQAELDALTDQAANDRKYIDQVQVALAEKKQEWKDRQELRAAELAAMSKAIHILTNDDARDVFKRSLESQGYSFLQENQQVSRIRSAVLAAASQIRKAVVASNGEAAGRQLVVLAARIEAVNSTHFTEVIDAIDKMVVNLQTEEETDLARKEQCEKDRADDTRTAALNSRTMDDFTDTITRLNSEIDEIKAEIVEKTNMVEETQAQVAAATSVRESEHKEWQSTHKDDEDALATVKRAKEVLANFYSDNNLMLVQQPVLEAGKAPPPPPATWDAPYGGQTAESTSIIEILHMIADDIQKDISTAKAAEDKSKAEYDAFEAESLKQIEGLNSDITDLRSTQADKEGKVTEHTESRRLKSLELDLVMGKLADAKPGCDFIAINYQTRLQNRQIEMDGLIKAKAILTGGEFNAGPDPKREMKPGDAFLMRRHA